jgi:nucleotide-binding universal stress UspA family protein
MTTESTGQQLVVVGVDGSAGSVAALDWVRHYAAATGARVQAILAWHYPGAVGGPPMEVAPDSVHHQTEEQERQTLNEAVTKVYGGPAPAGVEATLGYGHPAEVLIEASKEADLLVVGRRGHRAFAGMLLGSVSLHCVVSAACPVVVVRSAHGQG